MAEDLLASTPDIIRKLLIDNDFGVMPGIRQVAPGMTLTVDPPQIFTRSAPEDINYLIFLKTIAGRMMEMVSDGEPNEHRGLSVYVRAPTTEDRELDPGYTAAESLYRFLGKINNETVTIGSYTYRIQSIYRTQPVMDIGEEAEKSRSEWGFEVNVVFAYPPYQRIGG